MEEELSALRARIDAQEGQVAALNTLLLAITPSLSRLQLAQAAVRLAMEQQLADQHDGDDTPPLSASVRNRMLAAYLDMLESLRDTPG